MDRNTLFVSVLCSVLGLFMGSHNTVDTASIEAAKALKTHLFTTNNYDATLRPVANQNTAISVYISVHLFAINSVDEKAETLQTTGFLTVYWDDEFLAWNASHFDELLSLFIPQDTVWKPDLTLQNSNLEYKAMGHKSLNVEVLHTGRVNWYPSQVFESTCAIDITSFPFDTQTCDLKFVAWSYSIHFVRLSGATDGFDLNLFAGSSAWEIIDSSWHTEQDVEDSAIVFTLKMARKPLYNLLTLVFPVIMLAILNLFVFTLPSDGGEKAGYAVTVFLAFAVFLTIMEASFPQNSDTVAFFAIYVVIQTAQSTVITLIALILIRCASFDEQTHIPGCVLAVAKLGKCKSIRSKVKKSNTRVDAEDGVNKQTAEATNNDKNNADLPVKDCKSEKEYTWKYVVNALDIIFFVFFLLVFLTSTCVCLILAKY